MVESVNTNDESKISAYPVRMLEDTNNSLTVCRAKNVTENARILEPKCTTDYSVGKVEEPKDTLSSLSIYG